MRAQDYWKWTFYHWMRRSSACSLKNVGWFFVQLRTLVKWWPLHVASWVREQPGGFNVWVEKKKVVPLSLQPSTVRSPFFSIGTLNIIRWTGEALMQKGSYFGVPKSQSRWPEKFFYLYEDELVFFRFLQVRVILGPAHPVRLTNKNELSCKLRKADKSHLFTQNV